MRNSLASMRYYGVVFLPKGKKTSLEAFHLSLCALLIIVTLPAWYLTTDGGTRDTTASRIVATIMWAVLGLIVFGYIRLSIKSWNRVDWLGTAGLMLIPAGAIALQWLSA